MKKIPKFPCQIPDLKLSCWGCCGRCYKSKNQVESDIKINTKKFFKLGKMPSTIRLLQYRDRFDPDPWKVKSSGICSNLVYFGENIYACPLHPFINELIDEKKYKLLTKKDLRYKYCDVNHECDTFVFWKTANDIEKRKLLEWIKKQKYDHYNFSIENVDGVLMTRYRKENKK
jgi:hypothetical protein